MAARGSLGLVARVPNLAGSTAYHGLVVHAAWNPTGIVKNTSGVPVTGQIWPRGNVSR